MNKINNTEIAKTVHSLYRSRDTSARIRVVKALRNAAIDVCFSRCHDDTLSRSDDHSKYFQDWVRDGADWYVVLEDNSVLLDSQVLPIVCYTPGLEVGFGNGQFFFDNDGGRLSSPLQTVFSKSVALPVRRFVFADIAEYYGIRCLIAHWYPEKVGLAGRVAELGAMIQKYCRGFDPNACKQRITLISALLGDEIPVASLQAAVTETIDEAMHTVSGGANLSGPQLFNFSFDEVSPLNGGNQNESMTYGVTA